MIQYDGNLKTERYGDVRVVSLSSLMKLYQGFCFEGVQKYGDRDVSEGSLVFRRPKDGEAGDEPLPSKSVTKIILLILV